MLFKGNKVTHLEGHGKITGPNQVRIHLVPLGTPGGPRICYSKLTKTGSSFIRPATPAVRLKITLERAVACSQFYVVTILSSLYLKELIRYEVTLILELGLKEVTNEK